MSVILDLWFGHALKVKSNYLSCYGKSPLPQGCQNSSIIEEQQLWCSAWLTKALAIEILPRWCLHSGSPAPADKSCQQRLHPGTHLCRVMYCSGNAFHLCILRLLGGKIKKFPTLFPHKCQDFFCLNPFPLKPAWIGFQINFSERS